MFINFEVLEVGMEVEVDESSMEIVDEVDEVIDV